jgi:peptidoglycan hydrolase-like protein with peptidoglycan-binding domain
MNIRFVVAGLLLTITCALADDQTARAQQQLKDQGFYYGEITGEKNADTAAAIRRFQIRNGLEINGELNDETLKALAKSSANTPNKSVAAATPLPPTSAREQPQDQARYPEEDDAGPRNEPPPVQDRQVQPPVYSARPMPSGRGGYFAHTPYEDAPPEVQEDLIARAQDKLAKRDLYRGAIDGIASSAFEFSLRSYQSRVGLQPSGRLDLDTLAALELLPGANRPVFIPPPRRAYREPPVRGEWVRP